MVTHQLDFDCDSRSRGQHSPEGTSRPTGLSLIIPVKAEHGDGSLSGFVAHYGALLAEERCFPLEVIVADESPDDLGEGLFETLEAIPGFRRVVPANRTGLNDKVNGLLAGASVARYERLVLLDDHYRPTHEELFCLWRFFDSAQAFKCFVRFRQPTLGARLDLAGAYVICVVSGSRQFFGHICFVASLLDGGAEPSRDVTARPRASRQEA